jgi:hypothetical protein
MDRLTVLWSGYRRDPESNVVPFMGFYVYSCCMTVYDLMPRAEEGLDDTYDTRFYCLLDHDTKEALERYDLSVVVLVS